jgi:hypothetical protein
MKSLLGWMLLFAATLASAADIEPFSATFTVKRNGDTLGHMAMRLTQPTAGAWSFVSRTEGEEGLAGFLGVTIEERSQLVRDETGFASHGYRYEQKMIARNRTRELTRAEDGAIRESDGDDHWEYSSQGPIFDRHSVTLGIAQHLAHGPAKGVIFDLPVASKGKIEKWRFLVVGEEQIETGKGRMNAIRVERMRENSDRKTVSWHAEAFGYLPVKVEQTEPNGDSLQSVLDSYVR